MVSFFLKAQMGPMVLRSYLGEPKVIAMKWEKFETPAFSIPIPPKALDEARHQASLTPRG